MPREPPTSQGKQVMGPLWGYPVSQGHLLDRNLSHIWRKLAK